MNAGLEYTTFSPRAWVSVSPLTAPARSSTRPRFARREAIGFGSCAPRMPQGSPELCDSSECRGVLAGRPDRSLSWTSEGRYSFTGRSRSTTPSSASWSTRVAVSRFDTDATRKIVEVRTGTSRATSAIPTPSAIRMPAASNAHTARPCDARRRAMSSNSGRRPPMSGCSTRPATGMPSGRACRAGTSIPSTRPLPVMTASLFPFASAAAMRAGYAFRSWKPSGSAARRSASCSSKDPGSSRMPR